MSKKKKKPEHYWNLRIVTRWINGLPGSDGARGFSIFETHYENGKPVATGEHNILQALPDVKSLKQTMKYIKRALKKPILDGDNNLKEWSKDQEESWKDMVKEESKEFLKKVKNGEV